MSRKNRNLLEPDPILLPEDHPDVPARGSSPASRAARAVAARYPAASLAWARLAATESPASNESRARRAQARLAAG